MFCDAMVTMNNGTATDTTPCQVNDGATKIGGAPNFIQEELGIGGTFLAQLASIQPAPRVPFPWVNREAPYTLDFDENGIYGNQQTIGDMGSLYLFLQEDGNILATMQSY